MRLQVLKKAGFTVPRLTIPRPNPLRKVPDEKVLVLSRSGLSISEIAAKVGIATNNVWKRIKHLSKRALKVKAKRGQESADSCPPSRASSKRL